MDLKVDKVGFSIDGRRYNIGDVIKYPNQKNKRNCIIWVLW